MSLYRIYYTDNFGTEKTVLIDVEMIYEVLTFCKSLKKVIKVCKLKDDMTEDYEFSVDSDDDGD